MVKNWLIVYLATCFISPGLLFSQPDSKAIIVGELASRFDFNNIDYYLRTKTHPIAALINNQKVQVSKRSNTELVLVLTDPITSEHKTVVIRLFDTETALMIALIIDDVDFAYTESAQMADDIHKSNHSVRIMFHMKPLNYVKMIAYNNRHPIFHSRNVRQALSYAINKSNIMRTLLNNQATITSGPIDSKSKFYVSGFEEFNYAPRDAIKLLQQDGWSDVNRDGILEKQGQEFSITLSYNRGNTLDEQVVRMVKVDWNKIGIDVSIRPVLKSEQQQKLKTFNYEAMIMNMQFKETLTSMSDFWGKNGQLNIFGFKNSTVDRYLYLAAKADERTKFDLMKGVLNNVILEQPASYLFFLWMDWYFVNTNKFDGFMDAKGRVRPFQYWTFKR